MIIGYGKLGRSMPLDLTKCGPLGGDVEMVPTVQLLAERHPEHEFWLVGRNTLEYPELVGMPKNVFNPWIDWAPEIRQRIKHAGLDYANLSVADHVRLAKIHMDVVGDVFAELDGMVMWLGQHGTTNTPQPGIRTAGLTKPYDWSELYCSYMLLGINAWRDGDPWNREEVLLNADPRNNVKYRDGKWPWRHPVLSQYNETYRAVHERYGEHDTLIERHINTPHMWDVSTSAAGRWTSRVSSVYSRLEVNCLIPGTPFAESFEFNPDWHREHDFGIVINETRRQGKTPRIKALREWVLPLNPGFIHGKWSPKSQEELGRTFEVVPVTEYFKKIQSARCTLTTPPSGSGWATAKPWESFAAGVVCFFHPDYDTQDNILGDAPEALRYWLRPKNAWELHQRVKHLGSEAGRSDWESIITMQKNHVDLALHELTYLTMIEDRLFGGTK